MTQNLAVENKEAAVLQPLGLIRIHNARLEAFERVAREMAEMIEIENSGTPFAENFARADRRGSLIIERKPDDLRTDRGSDVATWTTNRLLVDPHEQLFDRVWNSLPETKFKD